jgi:cyclase
LSGNNILLAKRIIPCLDVKGGRVVKGIKFLDHRDAGDPVSMASSYDKDGADELVFYDITASSDDRSIMLDLVEKVAEQVFIPLTVGGGLRSVDDMQKMLEAGADKVSINTAAVDNPDLIAEGADRFGCQCIVLGLDALRISDIGSPGWEVRTRTGHGGGQPTGIDVLEWVVRASELGAGEIVVNSMDRDGTLKGYDLDLLKAINEIVSVPVVASGGAGSPKHMCEALVDGKADAALAASILHYGTYTIEQTKEYISRRGVPIRFSNR